MGHNLASNFVVVSWEGVTMTDDALFVEPVDNSRFIVDKRATREYI